MTDLQPLNNQVITFANDVEAESMTFRTFGKFLKTSDSDDETNGIVGRQFVALSAGQDNEELIYIDQTEKPVLIADRSAEGKPSIYEYTGIAFGIDSDNKAIPPTKAVFNGLKYAHKLGESIEIVFSAEYFSMFKDLFTSSSITEPKTAGQPLDSSAGNLGLSEHKGKYYVYNKFEKTITAVADNGSGKAKFTSTAHGLSDGDYVNLQDFSESTYNVVGVVANKTADTFDIETITYVATDAGKAKGFENYQGILLAGQTIAKDASFTLYNLRAIVSGFTGLGESYVYVDNGGVFTTIQSDTSTPAGTGRNNGTELVLAPRNEINIPEPTPAGVLNCTAEHNIGANTAVYMNHTGKLRKCRNNNSTIIDYLGSADHGGVVKNVKNGVYGALYRDNSDGHVKFKLFTYDYENDTHTNISTTEIEAGTNSAYKGGLFLSRVDETKLRAYWKKDDDNIGCRTINIDAANSVTLGGASNIPTNGYAMNTGGKEQNENGDVCFCVLKYVSSDNYSVRCLFITGEFTGAYINNPIGVDRIKNINGNCAHPASLANGKWLVAFRKYDGSLYKARAGIVGVGQADIAHAEWPVTDNKMTSVIPFGSDKFVVGVGYIQTYGRVVTCTDSAISVDGTPVGGSIYLDVYPENNAYNVRENVAFVDGGSGYSQHVYKVILNGLNLSVEQLFTCHTFEYVADDVALYVAYGSGTNRIYSSVADTRKKCLGVSREAKSADEEISITTLGGIHSSESGLMAGEKYKLLDKTFGINISDTEVLFDNPPRENNN